MKLKFVFFLYVTYSLLFSLCMSLFVSHCIYHGFLLFYMCMCHCFTLISLSISHYYLFFLSEFIVSWCFFLYMSLFILFSLCICHCSFTFLGMCHFLVFFLSVYVSFMCCNSSVYKLLFCVLWSVFMYMLYLRKYTLLHEYLLHFCLILWWYCAFISL